MKSIRLLPVVIAAALALLLFKGVGLLTTGGYIFTGASAVQAAGETADHAPVAEGQETTIELPPEPTMVDDSPTIGDLAPTLGAAAEGDHAAPAAADAEHGTEAATEPADAAHPEPAESAEAPAQEASAEAAVPEASAEHGAEPPAIPDIDAPAEVAEDPMAEAVPMFQDGSGVPVPLTAEDGGSLTENTILERLGVRRAELDVREEELALRLQLVEAAEAQLEARAAALAEVEARINTLLDQQAAAEEGQFAAIISMYEQMKPTEAAAIFNELEMRVLVKVAKGMNPRKMAPVLAKMTSARAQQLTLALAAIEPEPVIVAAPAPAPEPAEDLAALPQIVGQ